MKAFLHSINYWKIAFLLCGIMYMASVAGTFLAVSETWSDETWRNMGVFLKTRFLIACFAAGLPVIIAFLNKTVSRLEAGQEDDTRQWKLAQADKAKSDPVV